MERTTDTGYERPSVADYGDLAEMTRAQWLDGPEDGASKLQLHHSLPLLP
jgi:hypothetical protein